MPLPVSMSCTQADPSDPLGDGPTRVHSTSAEEGATQARAGAAGDAKAPAWITGAYSLRVWGPEFLPGDCLLRAGTADMCTSL